FPRITLVRRPGTDGARYWGPYTHAIALRTTLKTVRRVIPYRSCKDSEFALGRPCFYYHLNLCPAPCAGSLKREDYHEQPHPEVLQRVRLGTAHAAAAIRHAVGRQYYANATHIPKESFVPDALPDRELIEQWLSERRGSVVTVRVPQRGKQRELLQQPAANAQETMRQLRIKLDYDAERTASLLNDLQARLALKTLPVRIECYDISNIQGKYPVGSMVVFEEGRPKPAHYRHFRIKTVQGANDFAMLQEVLRRRFSRHARSEEGTPEEPSFSRLPDLVLIDGGKGQLSAAREVMEAIGLASVPTLGLA